MKYPIRVFVPAVAVLMMVFALAGCKGTQQAYSAADGLEETAFVMNQHYLSLVREANRLRSNGTIRGSALSELQDLVRETRPLLAALSNSAAAYEQVASAENESELTAAIAQAATALSDLVNAIRKVGGSAHIDYIERDLNRIYHQLEFAV